VTTTVHDDRVGDKGNGDTEWDNDSFCRCAACPRTGPVSDFHVSPLIAAAHAIAAGTEGSDGPVSVARVDIRRLATALVKARGPRYQGPGTLWHALAGVVELLGCCACAEDVGTEEPEKWQAIVDAAVRLGKASLRADPCYPRVATLEKLLAVAADCACMYEDSYTRGCEALAASGYPARAAYFAARTKGEAV
jgi:hypothetical protein